MTSRGKARRANPATGHPPGAAAGAIVIGGDYQGLGIARSLGRRRVPVIVVDDEASIARASRYVSRTVRVDSLRSADKTVETLMTLPLRMDVQGWVLFPTREETVAALAQHRDWLGKVYRVPTPEWPVVRTAWDKRETYRVAQELGVPTPRCWFPRSAADLDEIAVRAPVVVKPAVKEHFFYATGAKAWRADSPGELRQVFEQATRVIPPEEVIVQELVPGGGNRQAAYCAFFKDGAAVASMTVLRRRQHPSDFGRASTYVETVPLPELVEPSERFLKEIGYYGLVELEYKQDPEDGKFRLLDVNARTWGYHTIGAAAGVDFPYLLYRDQIGLPIGNGTPRPGVRWVRLSTDVPNAVRDVARRKAGLRDYLHSLRQADVEAVWSREDPGPGILELGLLPYLAVRRGL